MEEIRKQLEEAVRQVFGIEAEVEMTLAPEDTGADYASNVALKLAKVAHKAPIVIAEELKQAMAGLADRVGVEVAAPGFLNFISPDEYYDQKIAEIAQNQGILAKNILLDEYDGKTVVTEFSDPNPFKVLHVGHLYTSIVGDSISRLLEFAGAKVVRTNFGGDVGLHVGKTMWALRNDSALSEMTIEEIAKCYVEGTRAYEEDEEAKREIVELNKIIYDLAELGEEKCHERLELEKVAEDFGRSTAEIAQIAELYWRGRELSYEYFKDFYARIGVKFDKFYPESSVVGKGLEEVREHVGTVYEESKGAIVFRGEKVGLHTRVFINREGVPTYETKDVGLIFTKWRDFRFDESVVITGNEQTEYMRVVLASVKEYAPELVERTRHLTHGLVKLQGNVKMSSRKGNFLKAVDVIEMVEGELGGKDADQRVVLAALKYAFLKYKMGGDIVFDPKESVATTGNSGVYLLYSAVRAKKILQKLGGDERGEQRELSDDERRFVRRLGRKLAQYEDVMVEAVREKAPYRLCSYLYELAQEFSRFYERVRVVGGGHEDEVEKYVRAYAGVMEQGLGVLGVGEIPEGM